MWELDHKGRWVPKNWCFHIVVLKTLESPLDCKGITPVNPKGIFIGRTDAEAETPILWPPDVKSQLTGKDPDTGKDWGQEEKGTTYCSPWGHKVSDTTGKPPPSCSTPPQEHKFTTAKHVTRSSIWWPSLSDQITHHTPVVQAKHQASLGSFLYLNSHCLHSSSLSTPCSHTL